MIIWLFKLDCYMVEFGSSIDVLWIRALTILIQQH